MGILYSFGIHLYYACIFLASFFNQKAKKWITGRRNLFQSISETIRTDQKIFWFHAASLGEFEQGRPVMEAIKKKISDSKILLTFFSPSGYEVRKNYPGADYVFYLPPDSLRNAKRFIQLIKPVKVFFIKYEFWFHYLKTLHKEKIPVYLISGIFRNNQVFFKWYGKWYRKWLHFFDHIFVQDQNSYELMKLINMNDVTISGDTRFDRVVEIAAQAKQIMLAEKFKNSRLTIVCGSTWTKDEDLLIQFINEIHDPVKFIIAPHEIDENHIRYIISKLKKSFARFSTADLNNIDTKEVLIIDNIGMLSSLYKYGEIAYIGGGFGVGIHNILEAAAFGVPVFFGPNYKKFKEATDLISMNGAFSISSFHQLKEIFNDLFSKKNHRVSAGNIARNYIVANQGATNKIVNAVFSS